MKKQQNNIMDIKNIKFKIKKKKNQLLNIYLIKNF